jgi:ATP-dependent 26S proteasome regulatory subunit
MILRKIQNLLSARASLVYLISEEEERVERIVASAAERVLGQSLPIYTWSCLGGLRKGEEVVERVTDPILALDLFLKVDDESPLVFKDLYLFLDSSPVLIRKLKDCAQILRSSPKTIFFVCPYMALPHELFSLFTIQDVPLPRFDELSSLLDASIDARPDAEALRKVLAGDLKEKMVRAAMGFTANEAMDAFGRALLNQTTVTTKCVDLVLEEKRALVQKSGVLEFVSTDAGTWEIGGLVNLKKWLKERSKAFSPAAAKYGLTPPKGILVMGVSGCGKSLCIKAIASYWKLPLLRLDMGRVYDGLAGAPEQAMRMGIKTAEAVAPCVLWIDEIEAGIANQRQKAAGGSESRVLALFLTWMQEKTAPVFVGATANEVEILRKGRFDELFYMGLPSKEERKEILTIHMRKRKVNLDKFDMDYLAESTLGFNGAELEQGVISAIFEAMSRKTDLSEHILANALRNIVPLSRTMRERIEKIEAWARDRAMKASLSAFDGRN